VNGIVLEEMGEGRGISEIIDGDDLDVLTLGDDAKDKSPDATKTVNANTYTQLQAPSSSGSKANRFLLWDG